MTTVDDAEEAGARALADEWNTGERRAVHSAVAFVAARAMWPILSDGLRELHLSDGWANADCQHCGHKYPCATVRELDRIDKELGND